MVGGPQELLLNSSAKQKLARKDAMNLPTVMRGGWCGVA
jgi:hypothetical protein